MLRDGKYSAGFWLFALLVVLAPLPLGSNRSWALLYFYPLILAIWASILFQADARQQMKAVVLEARWPLILLLAFMGVQILQLLPLPAALHEWISPATHARWATVLADQSAPISLDPANSQIYLALSLVYASMFCFTLYFSAGRNNELQKLCYLLVGSALLQSMIGIFLFSISARYEIFHFSLWHNRVLGTFSYHNHMAGYLEMGLSVGLGLIVSQLSSAQGRSGWKSFLLDLVNFIDSPKMKLRLAMVIIVIALVLTRSRMGNAGFFASMLISTVLFMLISRKISKGLLILVFSMVVIDVLAVGSWVGLEKVTARIEKTSLYAASGEVPRSVREESLEERLLPASATLSMIRNYLWLGSGGGTFYSAFTQYRPAEIQINYDHAHNDYVEILSDFGVAGFLLLAGVPILVLVRVVKTIATRQSTMPRGVALGCLMAMLCIGIHSFVDFNLQLPANALTFVMVLALGWASLRANRKSSAMSNQDSLSGF